MIAHGSHGSRRFPGSSGTASSQFPFPTHGVGELRDLERKTAADLLSSLINLGTQGSTARRRAAAGQSAGQRPDAAPASARQGLVSAREADEGERVVRSSAGMGGQQQPAPLPASRARKATAATARSTVRFSRRSTARSTATPTHGPRQGEATNQAASGSASRAASLLLRVPPHRRTVDPAATLAGKARRGSSWADAAASRCAVPWVVPLGQTTGHDAGHKTSIAPDAIDGGQLGGRAPELLVVATSARAGGDEGHLLSRPGHRQETHS